MADHVSLKRSSQEVQAGGTYGRELARAGVSAQLGSRRAGDGAWQAPAPPGPLICPGTVSWPAVVPASADPGAGEHPDQAQ
jgi:hypothetical protein